VYFLFIRVGLRCGVNGLNDDPSAQQLIKPEIKTEIQNSTSSLIFAPPSPA
jgi:hypothetical protein